ncbi:MAG: hypothetical protein LBF85_02995, partial [Tannerella sp.]|nr:hypothetical protein [Tannerella sp.]
QRADNKQITKHVIGRNEAIQQADSKQLTKHVTGRREAIRRADSNPNPNCRVATLPAKSCL